MGKLAHEMHGTCERSDANETYVIEKMSSFEGLWKYITKKSWEHAGLLVVIFMVLCRTTYNVSINMI